MRNLRGYQLRASSDAVEGLLQGKRVLVVAPPAAGKTTIGADVVVRMNQRLPMRTLWIAHRIELVEQAAERLREEGLRVGIVGGDITHDLDAPIIVATIQTLLKSIRLLGIGFVVLDECFVAGTMVEGFRIEDVRTGDKLSTGTVRATMRRKPSGLVRVTIGGTRTVCTPNHPFWVAGKGYVQAESLVPDDLCCVQRALFSGKIDWTARTKDLFAFLQKEAMRGDDGQNEQGARESKNDTEKSDADSVCSEEDAANASCYWSQAIKTRRERKRNDQVAANDAECAGSQLDTGVCCLTRKTQTRIPDALQAGLSFAGIEARDRAGRIQSLCLDSEGTRPEERFDVGVARVDSVEILEPGSDGRYGGLCPDGYVYNLSINRSHVYFANGILVHNCHHYSSADWGSILAVYPAARLLGLTATPQRDDGQGLGDIFNHLVVAATYSELLAGGFICPCPRENVLAPPPDESGYDLALDPLKAWQRYGQGRSTLAFASNVADATRYAKEFNEAGIVSAVLDGKTPDEQRALILRAFEQGTLRVLWSVGILTEGTDLPRTACVLLARECGMQRTYLQITGRGGRVHPSKSDLIVIDLVGATLRHGLPAEDRIYSLTDPDPIKRTSPQPMRQCLECGHTIPSFFRRCPDCGYVHGPRGNRAPKIWDLELAAVYEAENTPKDAKRKELLRLVEHAKRKGYSLKWVSQKYRDEFGGQVPDLREFASRFPDEEAKAWKELREEAAARGYHWKWAEHRFKAKYGHLPGRYS